MGVLELAHVDRDHVALTAIQQIGQRRSGLGFAHAAGAHQHEHTDRFSGIVELGAEGANPSRDGV